MILSYLSDISSILGSFSLPILQSGEVAHNQEETKDKGKERETPIKEKKKQSKKRKTRSCTADSSTNNGHLHKPSSNLSPINSNQPVVDLVVEESFESDSDVEISESGFAISSSLNDNPPLPSSSKASSSQNGDESGDATGGTPSTSHLIMNGGMSVITSMRSRVDGDEKCGEKSDESGSIANLSSYFGGISPIQPIVSGETSQSDGEYAQEEQGKDSTSSLSAGESSSVGGGGGAEKGEGLGDGLLLRWTDDSLYLTTSFCSAVGYLEVCVFFCV